MLTVKMPRVIHGKIQNTRKQSANKEFIYLCFGCGKKAIVLYGKTVTMLTGGERNCARLLGAGHLRMTCRTGLL